MVAKKSKSKKNSIKIESVAEFLARGGQITKCEPQAAPDVPHVIAIPHISPHETSLGDSEILFGEGKIKASAKDAKIPRLDMSKIPADLLEKLNKKGKLL
jgi:hypothetical protein